MGCRKLEYRKPIFKVLIKDKDPGPPICDDVFCVTGGNIDSGSLPENDIYFFHPDHLGSTSYITNIAGETVQFNTYMPFGESFVSQKRISVVSNYLFNSKEVDTETGLYYYGARYYNSKTSVWLSVDPIALYDPIDEVEHYLDGQHNGGYYNPRNTSVYGYTYQNPIRYIDPNGKQVEWLVSTFNNPGELKLKLPNNNAQKQSYGTTVKSNKAFESIKNDFISKPQNFLSNSKAKFNAPVDKDGKPTEFKVGSYIKINIDGPTNNAYVKVLGMKENKEGDSGYFSVTFGTMEGHIEKGKITFRLYDMGEDKFRFTINSISEVDMGTAQLPLVEDYSRNEQSKSWKEVLDNMATKTGGKEVEGSRTVIVNGEKQ